MSKRRLPAKWDLETTRGLPYGRTCKVQEIVDDFERSDRFHTLAFNTKRGYRASFKSWRSLTLPDGKSIFDMYVHRVDYQLVDHYVKLMRFKYSATTIRYMCMVMSIVWKLALRNRKVAYNPWDDLNIKINNERDVTCTKQDITNAVVKAEELGYHTLALYLLFMYETGQRPWSDIRNFKWENIRHVGTTNNLSYTLSFTIAKTGVHIQLPINADLVARLDSRKRYSEYIFAEEGGERKTQQALHNQFRRVKREAKLADNLQFRDIRRSLAVELVEAGATRDEIRSVFGWQGDSVVHRYARLRYQTAENALRKRDVYQQSIREELCQQP